jgi:GrpB-like predicted nucleotidyltransferase (UPF0157 family)
VPAPEEITRHHSDEPPPGESPWVDPASVRPYEIDVVEPDPAWPGLFEELSARVRSVLGDRVLELHHVGSTSVPGLPAKPVIDADLVVADPADEAAYVPALVAAGFRHHVREPWWHEHRMLKWDEPRAHLHVFGPDCPEVVRHVMFRDWLRAHDEDRELYAAAKRSAATATNARPGGGTGMDYNRVKEPVVREIYDRIFRAHGLL